MSDKSMHKSLMDEIAHDEIENILRLHKQGESVTTISQALKISRSIVAAVIGCGSVKKYYKYLFEVEKAINKYYGLVHQWENVK